ncbi:hypothetical protein C8R45DRAFT_928741 [Mycena sanguinolenta]|nr:hypothetical protein C8R45DRAFT_928741 [Mycena sanguinolenta]
MSNNATWIKRSWMSTILEQKYTEGYSEGVQKPNDGYMRCEKREEILRNAPAVSVTLRAAGRPAELVTQQPQQFQEDLDFRRADSDRSGSKATAREFLKIMANTEKNFARFPKRKSSSVASLLPSLAVTASVCTCNVPGNKDSSSYHRSRIDEILTRLPPPELETERNRLVSYKAGGHGRGREYCASRIRFSAVPPPRLPSTEAALALEGLLAETGRGGVAFVQ